MKTIIRGAAALFAAAALSGCADMVTGGPLIRPGEPLAAINIINVSGDRLDAILISACSASTYGLNRLPSGTAIPPGGSYSFTVSAGCWDVMGGTIGYGDGASRIQVGPGQTYSIRVN